MREISIKDKVFQEDEAYPLWLIIKRIEEIDDAISISFIMAKSHKDALIEAKKTPPEGEIAYISSLWNLLERLEFMVEKDG